MAATGSQQGAEWLHVVNLDGALGATRSHLTTLHRPSSILIQHPGLACAGDARRSSWRGNCRSTCAVCARFAKAVATPIQFGGGLRTLEDIQLALELGADACRAGDRCCGESGLVSEATACAGAPSASLWASTHVAARLQPTAGKRRAPSMRSILATAWRALGVRTGDLHRYQPRWHVDRRQSSRRHSPLWRCHRPQSHCQRRRGRHRRYRSLKAHEHYNIEGVIVGQAIYTGALALPAPLPWATAR